MTQKNFSCKHLVFFSRQSISAFLLALSTGCATYKVETKQLSQHSSILPSLVEDKSKVDRERALRHPIYTYIPRHRKQIQWYDLPRWTSWALFGNDDDGIFGEEPTSKFKTEHEIGLKRAQEWTLRNPLHNFTFYVIGNANRPQSELQLISVTSKKIDFIDYDEKAKTVFSGKKSSFFLGFHGWKPFISFRLDLIRRFEFYLGWRERGNFGIKFIPFKEISEEERDTKKQGTPKSSL